MENFLLDEAFLLDEDMQAPFGGDESEDYNFADSLIVDPETNFRETTYNPFNAVNLLRGSSKGSYFLDGPVSSDTDNEGFNKLVKRCCSLANR